MADPEARTRQQSWIAGLLDGDGQQPARDGLAAWRRRQRGRGGGRRRDRRTGRRTTRVQVGGAPAWSRVEGTDEPRTVVTRDSRVRCGRGRGRGCSVLGKAGAGTRVDVDFGMLG